MHKQAAPLLTMLPILLILLIPSCPRGTSRAAEPPNNKTFVLVTIFPLHLIARNIAQGRTTLRIEPLLAAATGCPHDYALTPAETTRLAKADALVINGLGMEDFLAPALENIAKSITVHNTSASAKNPIEHNPHLFTSPAAQADIATEMAEFFTKLDPGGARLYHKNAARYADAMHTLAAETAAAVTALPNNRFIASRETFGYLARDTGMDIVGSLPEQDAGASAAELLALANRAREANAAAVVIEPQYPDSTGETVAETAGIPVLLLDPVATGPENAPLNYFTEAMRKNIRTLSRLLPPEAQ